jgi:hypothetical protein
MSRPVTARTALSIVGPPLIHGELSAFSSCHFNCSRIAIALLHYPLDGTDKPLSTAPELVVKTKPPEQDLDFTTGLHFTIVQIMNDLASR